MQYSDQAAYCRSLPGLYRPINLSPLLSYSSSVFHHGVSLLRRPLSADIAEVRRQDRLRGRLRRVLRLPGLLQGLRVRLRPDLWANARLY